MMIRLKRSLESVCVCVISDNEREFLEEVSCYLLELALGSSHAAAAPARAIAVSAISTQDRK